MYFLNMNIGHMMLGTSDYRYFTSLLMKIAQETQAKGKLIYYHEGGYSDVFVPFCGLAIMETLSGLTTLVKDPFYEEHQALGYHELQDHQKSVIDNAAKIVDLIKGND